MKYLDKFIFNLIFASMLTLFTQCGFAQTLSLDKYSPPAEINLYRAYDAPVKYYLWQSTDTANPINQTQSSLPFTGWKFNWHRAAGVNGVHLVVEPNINNPQQCNIPNFDAGLYDFLITTSMKRDAVGENPDLDRRTHFCKNGDAPCSKEVAKQMACSMLPNEGPKDIKILSRPQFLPFFGTDANGKTVILNNQLLQNLSTGAEYIEDVNRFECYGEYKKKGLISYDLVPQRFSCGAKAYLADNTTNAKKSNEIDLKINFRPRPQEDKANQKVNQGDVLKETHKELAIIQSNEFVPAWKDQVINDPEYGTWLYAQRIYPSFFVNEGQQFKEYPPASANFPNMTQAKGESVTGFFIPKNDAVYDNEFFRTFEVQPSAFEIPKQDKKKSLITYYPTSYKVTDFDGKVVIAESHDILKPFVVPKEYLIGEKVKPLRIHFILNRYDLDSGNPAETKNVGRTYSGAIQTKNRYQYGTFQVVMQPSAYSGLNANFYTFWAENGLNIREGFWSTGGDAKNAGKSLNWGYTHRELDFEFVPGKHPFSAASKDGPRFKTPFVSAADTDYPISTNVWLSQAIASGGNGPDQLQRICPNPTDFQCFPKNPAMNNPAAGKDNFYGAKRVYTLTWDDEYVRFYWQKDESAQPILITETPVTLIQSIIAINPSTVTAEHAGGDQDAVKTILSMLMQTFNGDSYIKDVNGKIFLTTPTTMALNFWQVTHQGKFGGKYTPLDKNKEFSKIYAVRWSPVINEDGSFAETCAGGNACRTVGEAYNNEGVLLDAKDQHAYSWVFGKNISAPANNSSVIAVRDKDALLKDWRYQPNESFDDNSSTFIHNNVLITNDSLDLCMQDLLEGIAKKGVPSKGCDGQPIEPAPGWGCVWDTKVIGNKICGPNFFNTSYLRLHVVLDTDKLSKEQLDKLVGKSVFAVAPSVPKQYAWIWQDEVKDKDGKVTPAGYVPAVNLDILSAVAPWEDSGKERPCYTKGSLFDSEGKYACPLNGSTGNPFIEKMTEGEFKGQYAAQLDIRPLNTINSLNEPIFSDDRPWNIKPASSQPETPDRINLPDFESTCGVTYFIQNPTSGVYEKITQFPNAVVPKIEAEKMYVMKAVLDCSEAPPGEITAPILTETHDEKSVTAVWTAGEDTNKGANITYLLQLYEGEKLIGEYPKPVTAPEAGTWTFDILRPNTDYKLVLKVSDDKKAQPVMVEKQFNSSSISPVSINWNGKVAVNVNEDNQFALIDWPTADLQNAKNGETFTYRVRVNGEMQEVAGNQTQAKFDISALAAGTYTASVEVVPSVKLPINGENPKLTTFEIKSLDMHVVWEGEVSVVSAKDTATLSWPKAELNRSVPGGGQMMYVVSVEGTALPATSNLTQVVNALETGKIYNATVKAIWMDASGKEDTRVHPIVKSIELGVSASLRSIDWQAASITAVLNDDHTAVTVSWTPAKPVHLKQDETFHYRVSINETVKEIPVNQNQAVFDSSTWAAGTYPLSVEVIPSGKIPVNGGNPKTTAFVIKPLDLHLVWQGEVKITSLKDKATLSWPKAEINRGIPSGGQIMYVVAVEGKALPATPNLTQVVNALEAGKIYNATVKAMWMDASGKEDTRITPIIKHIELGVPGLLRSIDWRGGSVTAVLNNDQTALTVTWTPAKPVNLKKEETYSYRVSVNGETKDVPVNLNTVEFDVRTLTAGTYPAHVEVIPSGKIAINGENPKLIFFEIKSAAEASINWPDGKVTVAINKDNKSALIEWPAAAILNGKPAEGVEYVVQFEGHSYFVQQPQQGKPQFILDTTLLRNGSYPIRVDIATSLKVVGERLRSAEVVVERTTPIISNVIVDACRIPGNPKRVVVEFKNIIPASETLTIRYNGQNAGVITGSGSNRINFVTPNNDISFNANVVAHFDSIDQDSNTIIIRNKGACAH